MGELLHFAVESEKAINGRLSDFGDNSCGIQPLSIWQQEIITLLFPWLGGYCDNLPATW